MQLLLLLRRACRCCVPSALQCYKPSFLHCRVLRADSSAADVCAAAAGWCWRYRLGAEGHSSIAGGNVCAISLTAAPNYISSPTWPLRLTQGTARPASRSMCFQNRRCGDVAVFPGEIYQKKLKAGIPVGNHAALIVFLDFQCVEDQQTARKASVGRQAMHISETLLY